jgi:hypothetical protein
MCTENSSQHHRLYYVVGKCFQARLKASCCFPETPKTQSRDHKSLFLKEIFHEMHSADSKSFALYVHQFRKFRIVANTRQRFRGLEIRVIQLARDKVLLRDGSRPETYGIPHQPHPTLSLAPESHLVS